ncbi:MAG: sigma-70 family RNA polymerase sigma factor [Verrucomicrobiota bacterium]
MHDTALLRRYVDSGSDDAFAALVQSYLPLVYGAALRRVGGDAHLAQDVAQMVFIALSRESPRLTQHSDLAGWLYTSTRFLAANALRSERRRQAREHAAQLEPTPPRVGTPGSDRVQGVLDDVMMELQQLDRQILLLRFYRGLRLAEIGSQINSSENAVQKRLERALEKLRSKLSRLGITSTAAALATALENHAAVSVPSGLAASALTAGLAGGSGGVLAVPAATVLGVSKLSLGVAAALVVGAVTTVIWYQRENTQLREELSTSSTLAESASTAAPGRQAPLVTGSVAPPSRNTSAGDHASQSTAPSSTASAGSRAPSGTRPPVSQARNGAEVRLLAEGLIPLVIDYPAPLFVGTPRPISLPNLQSEETRTDLMVPRSTALLSYKKPVTSSDSLPVIGELSFITDGDKSGRDGKYVELGPGRQWVQIDLGELAMIYGIAVWHFHSQTRVYHDVIVQLSTDPTFQEDDKIITLYHNDHDNTSSLGRGRHKAYLETHRGLLITGQGGAPGRYVRLYSSGNTSDELNHYCEVEVFGHFFSKLWAPRTH